MVGPGEADLRKSVFETLYFSRLMIMYVLLFGQYEMKRDLVISQEHEYRKKLSSQNND